MLGASSRFVAILALAGLLGTGCAAVPAQHIGVIESFGKIYETTWGPGLHLWLPWTGVHRINCRTSQIEERTSTPTSEGLVVGLEATGRELESVFAKNGITRIAAMGLPLDPNQHQAMVEIPSADAEPGTIVAEMQAGYMIKDRLLRPALVGVAKKAE